MIKSLNYLFVSCFGFGSFRFAPGTITSLITTIFLFSLFHIVNLSSSFIFLILFSIFIYSFYAVSEYIKNDENKDPNEIVIDEFIGQSIPICLYEIAHSEPTSPTKVMTFYFIMFILFRIFDITKPYPVSYYDRNFKNSFGVIMDDVCAGLYVVAILVFYMIITT